MPNALEGHKSQALFFLPGLFYGCSLAQLLGHRFWQCWSWSFPGGQAGRAHTLCTAKGRELLAARSSQQRAAAGGSNCHSPADICFGLLRLGSPGLLLCSEAAAQGRHRGLGTDLQQFKNHSSNPRARWGLEGVCHKKK